MKPGYAGMIASSDFRTTTAKSEVSQALPVGIAVIRGSAERSFALPHNNKAPIYGIIATARLAYTVGLPGNTAVEPHGYALILEQGPIWVHPETAVKRGERVFVRHTAANNLQPGGLRNNADNGTAFEAPGLIWETAAPGDGAIAKVTVNLP